MEAGAKVQLEGVDASGGFDTEISVTENVTSRWVSGFRAHVPVQFKFEKVTLHLIKHST